MDKQETVTKTPEELQDQVQNELLDQGFKIEPLNYIFNNYQEMHESIPKLEHQFESLISTIPKEERLLIDANIEIIKDKFTEHYELTELSEEIRSSLDQIAEIVIKYFPFYTKSGDELKKGIFKKNLQGFWRKRNEPLNDHVVIDCKLPTLVMGYLLSKHEIYPRVLVRYLKLEHREIPNFSAHPGLFFPLEYNKRADQTDDSEADGYYVHFTNDSDKKSRVFKLFDNEYLNFVSEAHLWYMQGAIKTLDTYFINARLIYELKYQIELEQDVKKKNKQMQFLEKNAERIVFTLLPYLNSTGYLGISNIRKYINHLLSARTRGRDSY